MSLSLSLFFVSSVYTILSLALSTTDRMSAAGDTLSSRSHKNERFIRIELSVRKQAPVINVASCVPVCRLWAELYSRTRVAPAWPEEGTAVGGGNESYLLSKGIRKISMDIIARDESGYRVEPPRRLELCPWLFAAHRTTNKRNSTCAYMIDGCLTIRSTIRSDAFHSLTRSIFEEIGSRLE